MTRQAGPVAGSVPEPRGDGGGGTVRGAGLMVLAMALFAVEDALLKVLTGGFATAQILWMQGGLGALALAVWIRARGVPVAGRDLMSGGVLLRTGCEALAAACYVAALARMPLSLASAVMQATPLVVAAGAAAFLGATVGPRRWLAIAVGFAGVLVVLRPMGGVGVEAALMGVTVLALAGRDLATRGLPASLSGTRLSFAAYAILLPVGLALQLPTGDWRLPDPGQAGVIVACTGVGLMGYVALVAATRTGEIAVVSSFRYTRLVFAVGLGAALFGDRLDGVALAGIGLIVASGLYAVAREARAARRALPKPSAAR